MIEYENAVGLLLQFGTVFLAITMCVCLARAVTGPKLADRIIATNMICVKTILLIVIVGINIGEEFLVDVALVYALLSFLAVVVFTRFMLQVRLSKAKKAEQGQEREQEQEKENSREGM